MSDSKEFEVPTDRANPEKILESYRQDYTRHGNDLDLLTQSMMLLDAGLYRESMEFAARVRPLADAPEEMQGDPDKPAAQAAFIAAAERARPLYEEAALDIEGKVERSSTMSNYETMLSMLKENPDW